MMLKEPIKRAPRTRRGTKSSGSLRDRLILSFLITFIVVDTCPYSNLPPGFIQTGLQQIQQAVLPESNQN